MSTVNPRYKELIEKYPELRSLVNNTYMFKMTYYKKGDVTKLLWQMFDLIDRLDKKGE